MKNLFVVLINVFDNPNGRKLAEALEAKSFTGEKHLKDFIEGEGEEIEGISLHHISDFMDTFNNQELYEDGYWFSYIYIG